MIQMFQVSKSYFKDQPALRAINLTVDKGEFVYLAGASGAGKTTLLKLIFCEEQVSSGQVLIDGRNIARLRPAQIPLLRRQIGVVFQDFRLIHTLTAAENVQLALDVVGTPRRQARKKVGAMLGAVGLGTKGAAYPRQLSAGEQQRVAIARALVNDPKILLADEPTGNLDADLTLEILDLLNFFNAKGTTIVVATHSQELLRDSVKRTIRLKDGTITEGGQRPK